MATSIDNMDFLKISPALESRGLASIEYKSGYDELSRRAEPYVQVDPGGDAGDLKRIKQYSLGLRQALLHRATYLFRGSLLAWMDDNSYSMTLSIRGHYETTAAIGFLHNRLFSLSNSDVDPIDVDMDILRMLLGTRDAGIKKIATDNNYQELRPWNVIKMLEYADRSMANTVFKSPRLGDGVLKDNYAYLCEFSHPNFHSITASFDINKLENRFMFRHDAPMPDAHYQLLNYLLISNPIFIEFFDRIADLVPHF